MTRRTYRRRHPRISAAHVAATAAAVVAVAAAASTLQPATATASACTFRDNGALPDPTCTPGSLNPNVQQSNIATTICSPGWTATIRPPEIVTERAKYKSMKAYGMPPTAAKSIEYDHLISLELGGDPGWINTGTATAPVWTPTPGAATNLWPEQHKVILSGQNVGSFTKDALENALKRDVCDGTVPLAVAQTAIATDWEAAYVTYVGKLPH